MPRGRVKVNLGKQEMQKRDDLQSCELIAISATHVPNCVGTSAVFIHALSRIDFAYIFAEQFQEVLSMLSDEQCASPSR